MRYVSLLLFLVSLAFADETPTQWIYRTVPSSQPLGHCWNGRTAHVKHVQGQYRVWCPGPQVDQDEVKQETPTNEGG